MVSVKFTVTLSFTALVVKDSVDSEVPTLGPNTHCMLGDHNARQNSLIKVNTIFVIIAYYEYRHMEGYCSLMTLEQ